MELYLILLCIGVTFLIYLYLKNMKKLKEIQKAYPVLKSNVQYLKSCKCKYSPDMKIKLHALKSQKKYNEMIFALEDKIYESNLLFNKLRYTIERTKFGEFLTASDIFKLIIEGNTREFKSYTNIEMEIKDFKSLKKEIEDLMEGLLDKSIELIRNQK